MVPLDTLKGLRFLQGLPEGHLRLIASVAEQTSYSAGAVIFREGQVCPSVFVVAEGTVSLAVNVPGSGHSIFQTVGPGELLGWTPLLGGGPMTATARALTPARVVAINAAQILAFAEREPQLGYEILKRTATSLAQRLGATRLQLLDVYRDLMPVRTDEGGQA